MNIDAKFAKNAGIKFILADYGYENKKIKSKIKIKKIAELKKIF